MNSESLKSRFHEAYRTFFLSSTVVLSMPFLINWAGDIFPNYRWLRIRQKLPLRMYVGIRKTESKRITLGNIVYYDIGEDRLNTSKLPEYAPFFPEVESWLNREYRDEISRLGGVEITIFSELSRWSGLGFISIAHLLILLAIERMLGQFELSTAERIERLSLLSIRECLSRDTPIRSVLRKSLKMQMETTYRAAPESQISSFFSSYYPIVTFTDDFHSGAQTSEDVALYGYRLNEIDPSLPEVPYMPMDYGILYSGRPVFVDQIFRANDTSLWWTHDVTHLLKKLFWEDLKESLPVRKPKFYKTFVDGGKNAIVESYGTTMGAVSIEILNLILRIYSNGYTESALRTFIDAINKSRYANYLTRKSSSTLNAFINDIMYDFGRENMKVLALAPNDTTIMGGSLIFAMPLEGFRKAFIDSVEETAQRFPGSKMLYASWMDGIESRGFSFEQDLDAGVRSEFFGREDCTLCDAWTLSCRIGRYDDLVASTHDGLCLDLVHDKLLLDGQKLTSRDIPSQSAALNVLRTLINRVDEDVSARELPASSYSQDKNEMISKVVAPLLKLLEKKKGIRLPLVCKWSARDFYIKLWKTDFPISVLKKIG